jgi:hypothetical protein
MISLWLTAIMFMASVLMGTAYDMSNAWVHKQTADAAAQASCTAGAMDMEYAANHAIANTAPSGPDTAMNFLNVSGGDCASDSSNSICYYAKLNGYASAGMGSAANEGPLAPAIDTPDPSTPQPTASNDVTWNLSTTPPLNAAPSSQIVGGAIHFSPTISMPAYLNVAVSENVPVTFMGIFAKAFRMSNSWKSITVVGHCNCGLSGASGAGGDATLANDEWCSSDGTNSTCTTNPVVPGAYMGWSWLALGWNAPDGGGLGDVYDGNADAAVPPSGTQAVISLHCLGGEASGSQPCRSPVFSFPDTPVSPNTPITIYMSGTEPTLDISTGGGAWVNLSTSVGSITPNTILPNFCQEHYPQSGAAPDSNAYDWMAGDIYYTNCSGWGVYWELYPSGWGPGVFTTVDGPKTDTAIVTGVTNLNQIHVSAGASYGNEYDGFIWAGWGGGSSQLHVATFGNN